MMRSVSFYNIFMYDIFWCNFYIIIYIYRRTVHILKMSGVVSSGSCNMFLRKTYSCVNSTYFHGFPTSTSSHFHCCSVSAQIWSKTPRCRYACSFAELFMHSTERTGTSAPKPPWSFIGQTSLFASTCEPTRTSMGFSTMQLRRLLCNKSIQIESLTIRTPQFWEHFLHWRNSVIIAPCVLVTAMMEIKSTSPWDSK